MSVSSISRHALSVDPDYPKLKGYVIANTGLAYYVDKDAQLADNIARRITRLGLVDGGAYLRLLRADELDGSELDKLIALLIIGETFFLRRRCSESSSRVIRTSLLPRTMNECSGMDPQGLKRLQRIGGPEFVKEMIDLFFRGSGALACRSRRSTSWGFPRCHRSRPCLKIQRPQFRRECARKPRGED